ncbi:MAG: 16S rRNA (adenine(1518)-N(6)/adenine(1519)-N(6))-dimethyltransferase RsmA [Bacteroidales bacterium]|nr:16S rRNA (adenine(1518)-N(6)/adenine(1519)-N(6))-dimethyltransferase RsmA [Bacteroidales bacterium]
MQVRAKKQLGQHFLTDENIAGKIAQAIIDTRIQNVLEVGPGMGVLTKYLHEHIAQFKAIEIDKESVSYLSEYYPDLEVISGDFLKIDLSSMFEGEFAVVGNFPYNISSQIFFRVLENRNRTTSVVGMIQKEVAERIKEKEGNKTYGILSVLLQTFFDVEYLFTVHENVFSPPPKVKSAVIKLTRNQRAELPCNEALYFRLIKESFGQRRKMLRSSLKTYLTLLPNCKFSTQRPEQLSIDNFIELTLQVEQALNEKKAH